MLQNTTVCIPAFHPFFLEKDSDWIVKNFTLIQRASRTRTWWQSHVLFLTIGGAYKLAVLFQKLDELGYIKTDFPQTHGEFAFAGGTLIIIPPGAKLFRIVFLGNIIQHIHTKKFQTTLQSAKPPHALYSFSANDYVTHLDHGIGIFRGYTASPNSRALSATYEKFINTTTNVNRGYCVLEYAPARTRLERKRLAGGTARADKPACLRMQTCADRLLVPFSHIQKLSPYYGFRKPTIHRLGNETWLHTKQKAKKDIIQFAHELLALYAQRKITQRQPYSRDEQAERILASSFPYEETPDQLKVMKDISRDLDRSEPMDRILVGDVGFGKTEVALRAAVRVALANKQVAVLAPTTILAYQHYHTFQKRLRDFPLRIAFVSRLVEHTEQKIILQRIASGAIDIIIATHRLLSKDVLFHNLGMLIIDEEQRFGVKHKERLKKFKNEVDILSLSATPIPRTLYMGMTHLKTISVIQTPPPQKLPTQTFVMPFSWDKAKQAIELECNRGGQVYFLYNRIATMETIKEKLCALLPHIRIGIIHGRMPEQQLVKTITDFQNGDIHVLLATTIIENGLDISNVNTLIVADASRLGLGQTHQLRGRIGRKDATSWAYLFYNPKRMTPQGKQRLNILKRLQYLGAGYEIAKQDLELRGAGNLLGKEQSGTINAVGLNLYMQMLSQEIERIQNENN